MTFEQKVNQYIESNHLFLPTDKVLVTLSGGSDSVSLLLSLLHLGYCCEAVHCNFHLRGEESMRDEEFSRQLCKKLHVPFHRTDLYSAEYAKENHLSVEMAAREQRYAYFETLRQEIKASVIAVAHHRDDSVETFLINLIRGTGINGLRGIRPVNGRIVRPLLCVSREEILSYLEFRCQDYVTDSTNLEDEFTRNKIRLNLLPMLKEINPSVSESIFETSARLDETAGIYEKVIHEGKAKVLEGSSISIGKLLQEPAPQSLLFEILFPLGFNSRQIKTIFENLEGQSGQRYYSEQWEALKDRDTFILTRKEEKSTDTELKEIPLAGGNIEFGNLHLSIQTFSISTDYIVPKDKRCACLDIDKITLPLTIRKAKQGDKFVPFGMKGKKLLSDFMTDLKFPITKKEQQTVVCCGQEIAWVTGERTSELYRVDKNTRKVLLISMES